MPRYLPEIPAQPKIGDPYLPGYNVPTGWTPTAPEGRPTGWEQPQRFPPLVGFEQFGEPRNWEAMNWMDDLLGGGDAGQAAMGTMTTGVVSEGGWDFMVFYDADGNETFREMLGKTSDVTEGMSDAQRRQLELEALQMKRNEEQRLWEREQYGQITPYQQAQMGAEAQWRQAQIGLEQQKYGAQLAAQPISWLQHAAFTGQEPVVQPWMLPLMSQQYPSLADLQVGQPIPGWGGQTGGQMPGYQPFQPTGQPADGGFVGPGGQMPTGGYPAVSGISAPSAIPPPTARKEEPWEKAARGVESYMAKMGYSEAEIAAEAVFGEYFGALPAGHYIEKFDVRDPNAPPQPSAHPPGYYPELGGRERTSTTPTPSRERPRAPARELPAPKSIAEIREAQKKKPAPTAPVGRKEPEFPVSRFAGGASYVPRDMTARLHRGEAVIPANQNPWGQPSQRTDIRERFNRPRSQRTDGGFVGPGGENPLVPRSQPAGGGYVGPGGINPALLPRSQPANGGFVGPGGINPALLPSSQPANGGFVGPGGINPALLPSSQPADGGFVGPGGIPPWLRPSSRPVDEGFVGPGGIQPYTPTPTQPTPGPWGPGMPGLLNPSAQLWSRMGPTSQQMTMGYEQARTGIRPEEYLFRLQSMAPPAGRYPGLSYAR